MNGRSVKHVLSVAPRDDSMVSYQEALDVLRTAGVPMEAKISQGQHGPLVARWYTVDGQVASGEDP